MPAYYLLATTYAPSATGFMRKQQGLLLIGIGQAHQIDLLPLFYVIPVLLGMKPLLHRNQLLFLLVILVVLMNHRLFMVGVCSYFLQHWYFKLLTKHNTPPIHKLSQQQNKTQMLLLVLVHLV